MLWSVRVAGLPETLFSVFVFDSFRPRREDVNKPHAAARIPFDSDDDDDGATFPPPPMNYASQPFYPAASGSTPVAFPRHPTLDYDQDEIQVDGGGDDDSPGPEETASSSSQQHKVSSPPRLANPALG